MAKKDNRSASRNKGIPGVQRIARASKTLKQLPARLQRQEAVTHELTNSLMRVQDQIGELSTLMHELQDANKRLDSLEKRYADLHHKFTIITRQHQPASQQIAKTDRKQTLADNHLLDKFYVDFEDRFRGTEEDIYARLQIYIPKLNKLKKLDSKQKLQILDIGCGRGEFLRIAAESGFKATGLDLNSAMAQVVRDKGFDVVEQDALSYLLEQPSGSLSAITGFHIVEHIPFDELLQLFAECHRVLIPGGMVIFETPNPENVLVGSWKFYYDPSHLKPLPPDMLAFAVQSAGFSSTEILRLHPEFTKETLESDNELTKRVNTHMFGPQDYSVIAVK